MENLALQLYNRTLESTGVVLNTAQSEKFKQACEKSVIDNPGLSLNHLMIASKIYLDFVLKFPELTL